MTRNDTLTEPKILHDRAAEALVQRLQRLEVLVRTIEGELTDETLKDEQKLRKIAERLAAALDGP